MQSTLVNVSNEVMTVKEVATFIRTNSTFVYKLINKGYLPAMNLGSRKVRKADLDRFLESAVGKDFTDLDNVTDLKKDVG